jgi:NADH:ubiquinone oxidoreductase subunit 5 (subunit L)/multisubunit Na+/H+ antiporter MnhA subunit
MEYQNVDQVLLATDLVHFSFSSPLTKLSVVIILCTKGMYYLVHTFSTKYRCADEGALNAFFTPCEDA